MSVTQINSGLYRSFEDTGEINPDGSAEFTTIFTCPWSQVPVYIPLALQPHPDFPSLLFFSGNVSRGIGQVGRIVSKYRGVFGTYPGAFTQTDSVVATTAEPLETAPIFNGDANDPNYNPDTAPLTRLDISTINNYLQTGSSADPSTVDSRLSQFSSLGAQAPAVKYFNKKLRGIDSFFRVGLTIKRHFISAALPSYTSKVGTIVNPDDFLPDGAPGTTHAPIAPPGQNYLFTGLSYSVQGGIVSNDHEFTLSGPSGWDIDLYGAN